MEKFILKYRKNILKSLATLLIGVVVFGLGSAILSPKLVDADAKTVTVTATVSEWASISVDPASASITPALVSGIGGTAVGTATSALTMGTNAPGGLTVTIKGDGGAGDNPSELAGTGTNIVSATAGLEAGTDGYGAQCTAGTETTCNGSYLLTDDSVRVIPGGTQTAATFLTGTMGSARTATLTVKAASVNTRTAGAYADTITLTATPGI